MTHSNGNTYYVATQDECWLRFIHSEMGAVCLLCTPGIVLAAGDAAENKDTNHCPYPTDVLVEGQAINKAN